MNNRLTWKEIQKLYDKHWVELVDYDWDDAEAYPITGVVRRSAKDRGQLSAQIEAEAVENNSTVLFVGEVEHPHHVVTTRGLAVE